MKSKVFRVGVFDSGIGGLTVLNACVKRLSGVRYYYYGDNLRAPYGNRGEEEIRSFLKEAFDKFLRMKTDAVVLACNTATAVGITSLRKEYPFPIIGSEPAVKPAAAAGKKILVLATETTARSARLQMLTGRFPECDFQIAACPYLAGAIERHFTMGEPLLVSAHLPDGKFDGVVLGCTHYSFFAREISSYYSAPVFDGAEGTAKRLEQVLFSIGLGRTDHFSPPQIFRVESHKMLKNNHDIPIKFVGNCKNINQNVYFQTFVSKKIAN